MAGREDKAIAGSSEGTVEERGVRMRPSKATKVCSASLCTGTVTHTRNCARDQAGLLDWLSSAPYGVHHLTARNVGRPSPHLLHAEGCCADTPLFFHRGQAEPSHHNRKMHNVFFSTFIFFGVFFTLAYFFVIPKHLP